MPIRSRPAASILAIAGALLAPLAAHAQVVARTTKLTNIETSYPHWSPDGRRLVYQSNRSGNSEIYAMLADGTGSVRLTDHPAADENPSWSPDGRRIAFRSYRDGNAEIYSMAADGSDVRNLTNHPGDDIHPYWSPDGSRILFNSNRMRDSAGVAVQGVYSMRPDGSDVRRLSRTAMEETYAQLAPDGRRIAFRRRLPEETPGWERNPGNSEIFVMDADGSGARRLTTHPGFDGWPAWSPDGQWVAYAGEGSGEFQLMLVRPDGTDARRLTEGPGAFTKPIFSPDGRRIVCTRTLDGNVEIFIIELDAALPAATGTPPASSPSMLLQRAADAMGGARVLASLPALTTGYHLLERSLGQEEWSGATPASSLQLGDREYSPVAQRERLTMRRHMSGGRLYERVVDAGSWFRMTSPTGAVVGSVGAENALSAALAAVHPEALLPRLLADPGASHSLDRPRVVAGRRVHAVRTRIGIQPITLFLAEDDGALLGVEWTDPDLIGGDEGAIRVLFSQYRPAVAVTGQPRLPHLVEVWRGARLWQVRSYAEYRVSTAAPATPASPPAPRRADSVAVVEVSSGAFHLRGTDYNSLMVDTGDEVVVVELPESPERGRAVIDVVRRRANGRPVSVVVTHAHEDHVAGLLAADDLTIIVHAKDAERVRALLRARNPSATPRLRVIDARARIGAGAIVVDLHPVSHSHSSAMLVAHLPGPDLLFEADLIRGLLPHSTSELVAWVEASGLPVRAVVSSHGGETPWSRVVETARAWREGLRASGR